MTAKLHLKDNVKPVFQKARPGLYALRPALEKELKKMEDEGIIEPVEVSNCATPIVCVPKTDGSVRVCETKRLSTLAGLATNLNYIRYKEKITNSENSCRHYIACHKNY